MSGIRNRAAIAHYLSISVERGVWGSSTLTTDIFYSSTSPQCHPLKTRWAIVEFPRGGGYPRGSLAGPTRGNFDRKRALKSFRRRKRWYEQIILFPAFTKIISKQRFHKNVIAFHYIPRTAYTDNASPI